MTQIPSLPARILLLGAGELGKEITIAAQRLGCFVIAVDSYPNAPAMQVADQSRVLDMSDEQALRDLLHHETVDIVVPEVEAIATQVLAEVEGRHVAGGGQLTVVPNAAAVQATMDRQRIRTLAARLPEVRTSLFRFASSADEVKAALEFTGVPAFVKPTMSSSGHGQMRITNADQAEQAWNTAQEGARARTGRVIVEESIDFDCEITLLTVRWHDPTAPGGVRTSFCAPIGHRQVDGDYVESWQPAEISEQARKSAQEMALAVTQALADAGPDASRTWGLFGVEFFVKGDEVWFSELSPRPHDTGMVTMITQDLSEFDLHVRAVLGLPCWVDLAHTGASAVVKSTRPIDHVRVNGVDQALRVGLEKHGQVRVFGKPATHAGRRMGVTLATGETAAQARMKATEMASLITLEEADCS